MRGIIKINPVCCCAGVHKRFHDVRRPGLGCDKVRSIIQRAFFLFSGCGVEKSAVFDCFTIIEVFAACGSNVSHLAGIAVKSCFEGVERFAVFVHSRGSDLRGDNGLSACGNDNLVDFLLQCQNISRICFVCNRRIHACHVGLAFKRSFYVCGVCFACKSVFNVRNISFQFKRCVNICGICLCRKHRIDRGRVCLYGQCRDNVGCICFCRKLCGHDCTVCFLRKLCCDVCSIGFKRESGFDSRSIRLFCKRCRHRCRICFQRDSRIRCRQICCSRFSFDFALQAVEIILICFLRDCSLQ